MSRFAVVGDPIAHSKSPRMHAAAYAALGMPHTYEAIRAAPEDLPGIVARLRAGGFAGLNVTVPYKRAILHLVDEIAPAAGAADAANTLVRTPSGRIVAHNTDVPALAQEIAALGARPGVALILGSGGAAGAAFAALMDAPGMRIVQRARGTPHPGAHWMPLVADPAVEKDVTVVVQATSCGMAGGPPGEIVANAVAWDALPDHAVALDIVYSPPTAVTPYRSPPSETPFLAAARARGLRAANGLGMLARQGALAFELWLGVAPPLDVMMRAIA